MSRILTSLDIGSACLKGIVATERNDGTLSVLSAFNQPSFGIRRGTIVDIEAATSVLRDTVVDLARLSKRATANVYVNVNSEHSRARLSRGIAAVARADQVIQPDDVEHVMQASRAVKLPPNHLVLHNILREYFVDDVGDITDPVGMVGNRLEVSTLVLEAFAPNVQQLVKHLERVGVRVGGLIFNPLAASRAVLSKRQKDLGVLLIDIGHGTTSFTVYEESKVLHTKSIPLGSSHITNDLAIGLRISIDAAEKLKKTYGYALAREIPRRETVKLAEVEPGNAGEIPRRFIAEITEVRLAEILELVEAELKSIGRAVQLPGGVVVTGGGSKLPGLTDLVKQELKLAAQVGFPNLTGLEVTNPAHQELIDDPGFAVAVGLLEWGATEDGAPAPSGGFSKLKRLFQNLMP